MDVGAAQKTEVCSEVSAVPGNREEAHVATTGLHGQAGVPHNH